MKTTPFSPLRVLVFVAAMQSTLHAQNAAPEAASQRPDFEPLRFREDWSFLRDESQKREAFDDLKYIPLNRKGEKYLSLGGELRPAWEAYSRLNWSDEPRDRNGYGLSRFLLHGDAHFGRKLRGFAQLASTRAWNKTAAPSPVEQSDWDWQQAWLEIGDIGLDAKQKARNGVSLRVGRQELLFGSQRLISVRDGPNVRRAFSGALLMTQFGAWRVDAFAMRPLQIGARSFDDGKDESRRLAGLYATHPLGKTANLDVYALRFDNRAANFDAGIGREKRHSFGARLWGEKPSEGGQLDFNMEAVLQNGDFQTANRSQRIRAWTLATETGFQWTKARWQPRVGLRADIASGDRNRNDNTLQTFNPLFPRGDYFSESALLGPSNFIDIQPSLKLRFNRRATLLSRWTGFWRYSTHDGIYAPSGTPLQSGAASSARFVGHEASFLFDYDLNPHTTLSIATSRFFAGRFAHETGARDLNYYLLRATLKF